MIRHYVWCPMPCRIWNVVAHPSHWDNQKGKHRLPSVGTITTNVSEYWNPKIQSLTAHLEKKSHKDTLEGVEWNKFNQNKNHSSGFFCCCCYCCCFCFFVLFCFCFVRLGEFYKWNLSTFQSSTFVFDNKVNFPCKNYSLAETRC